MTEQAAPEGAYGVPPPELASVAPTARQFSPLRPGSADLETVAPGSLAGLTVLAPPGTRERRYVLALSLRALRPGGRLLALAPKDKGGSRLGAELKAFGCEVIEAGRRHHRICETRRPETLEGLAAAIEEGAPRLAPGLGWTQPGVFSWDRLDPGTALLIDKLPDLAGAGADLGCGVGVLARHVLRAPAVTRLDLVDIDRRAIACARRNVEDPRATFHWADVRGFAGDAKLDFVVMNPPFHDGGAEDRALGQAFIAAAAGLLKPGGACWLVANRHLPYEAVLAERFARADLKAEGGGFKVYAARR